MRGSAAASGCVGSGPLYTGCVWGVSRVRARWAGVDTPMFVEERPQSRWGRVDPWWLVRGGWGARAEPSVGLATAVPARRASCASPKVHVLHAVTILQGLFAPWTPTHCSQIKQEKAISIECRLYGLGVNNSRVLCAIYTVRSSLCYKYTPPSASFISASVEIGGDGCASDGGAKETPPEICFSSSSTIALLLAMITTFSPIATFNSLSNPFSAMYSSSSLFERTRWWMEFSSSCTGVRSRT